LDVLLLRLLVTAQQQQNNFAANPPKVQAVTGSEVESSLPDSTPDILVIAEIAGLEAKDPRLYSGSGRSIQLP
jgi:hypothetical protein